MAVGTKATRTRFPSSKLLFIFCEKRTITERIAPDCIAISNVLTKSVWAILIRLAANIKCPVEEIGKNSLMPSTMPRITDCIIFTIKVYGTEYQVSSIKHQALSIKYGVGLSAIIL